MAIKRFTASVDTTITNAFMRDLNTRATGANMGASDILEVFSVYGQASTGSVELSRILIKFPTAQMSDDRTAGDIPASGSVNFYLRMFNARHSQTTPRNFSLEVLPISRDWEEGVGLDMDEYFDFTNGNAGCNWMSASTSAKWTIPGGDFYTASWGNTVTFTKGNEDIDVDVTELVEEWMSGDELSNYGALIKLIGTQEGFFDDRTSDASIPNYNNGPILHNVTGATTSYYTKKFFGRTSEFFYKRPYIEARWNSSVADDRGRFFYSSSLAEEDDNPNTVYMYNYYRGQLRNIPGDPSSVYVDLYLPRSGSNVPADTSGDTSTAGGRLTISVRDSDICAGGFPATGSKVSTGIYKCTLSVTAGATPDKKLLDVWHGGDGGKTYFTGTIFPKVHKASNYKPDKQYVTTISNLRSTYKDDQTVRFRLFVREKDWSPTIYSKATADIENYIIDSASYQIYRIADNLKVIPHNTGSDLATLLSYDVSGNYFDLDMSMLQPDYAYGMSFAYYDPTLSSWVEQKERFKFRVE